MTPFLTLKEERKLQKEFGERYLRWKDTYRPLDYDEDLNEMRKPVRHPHKPHVEVPPVPVMAYVLIAAGLFVAIGGMWMLHR